MSRRTFLTAAAVLTTAGTTAFLFTRPETYSALGIDPRAVSDEADRVLLAEVIAAETLVLASLRSHSEWNAIAKISELHVDKLGGNLDVAPINTPDPRAVLAVAGRERQADAVQARSGSFAMVLSAIAASHTQQLHWLEQQS